MFPAIKVSQNLPYLSSFLRDSEILQVGKIMPAKQIEIDIRDESEKLLQAIVDNATSSALLKPKLGRN